MPALGLDTLTDDQLIELARALAAELCARNPAVLDAADVAIRQQTALSARNQDRIWATRKWVAQMVASVVGNGYKISTWHSSDGRVRVYLEPARGGGHKWCLHVTGDSYNAPGRLTVQGRGESSVPGSLVRILCTVMAETYAAPESIDCDQAAATPYDVPSPDSRLSCALAEIADTEQRAAARAAYRGLVWTRENEPVLGLRQRMIQEHGERDVLNRHRVVVGREIAAPPEALAALREAEAERDRRVAAALAEYDATH